MGQVEWQQQKNIAITLVQNTWRDTAVNTATIIQSCTYFTQDFCSSVKPRAAVQRGGEPGSATAVQLPLSFHIATHSSRSPCVLDYALQRYTSWTRKAKHIFSHTFAFQFECAVFIYRSQFYSAMRRLCILKVTQQDRHYNELMIVRSKT